MPVTLRVGKLRMGNDNIPKFKSNVMRIVGVFFKGLAILSWLIMSFSLGMMGLCEINELSDIKKRELIDQKKSLSNQRPDGSGFKYEGMDFKTVQQLTDFIDQQKSERSNVQIFLERIKLVNNDNISNSVIFMLTSISFGIVGALTEQIKRIVVYKRRRTRALRNGKKVHYMYILEDVSILYRPLFGGLVGFMALGVTSLIPMLLQTKTEFNIIRPTALLFFCFFSGLMSDEIYEWLTGIVRTFFKKQTQPQESAG